MAVLERVALSLLLTTCIIMYLCALFRLCRGAWIGMGGRGVVVGVGAGEGCLWGAAGEGGEWWVPEAQRE